MSAARSIASPPSAVTDLAVVLEQVRRSERWRGWVAVGFLGGVGLLMVALALGSGVRNGDEAAALVVGIASMALGGWFLARQLRLRDTCARFARLLAHRGEVAHVFEQALAYNGRPVWNFFVCATGGDELRIAVFRPALRDALAAAIDAAAPGVRAPWSRDRLRAWRRAPGSLTAS